MVIHGKQATFFILAIILSFPVQAESLFVFLPTQVRAKVMQQQISQVCPELEVTVFGRGKDFRRQIKNTPPNAVLSLMPIIERLGSFDMVLQGSKNGQTREKYVIVSVGQPLAVQDMAQKKIGVVDLLGRKPMGEFIAGAFPVAVKLKRVTKTEDLLPLLTFGSVEAVLVSESHFSQLKAKSNLKLVASASNLTMNLVNLALNGANAKEKLLRCISRFDDKINATLGVDKWLTMSE
ncbi:hypothetical protein SG34_026405 [Thalassomonas viridans]|uniref:Uncharacterized protein n=1 Tax=Thalassomonas viridans TaxID=137584 RepID=A0AAE9Z1E8_9GAMM|nr:hypothetical protein [Thalassomonas viridans]WDE04803.1 hypothetical protein SG34_026405 [Thalassomonas viridans]